MKLQTQSNTAFQMPYGGDLTPHPDPSVRALEESLLQSFDEAMRTGQSLVHTPESIVARRKGRPFGTVAAQTKEALKMRVDADVLSALRATGKGWQTRVNAWLREGVSTGKLLA
jgi:uncharacterized protein (DUF4415 family)